MIKFYQNKRLSEKEACLVLAQILNAIEYLHNLDICHRDLKPENLLFNHIYELKLVDFGLSKICQNSNQLLETCCGSPCYASPETISSHPYVGKYVDMWSCGIILFAMICGYLPFDDDNQTILFQKISKCEYNIPTCVSPEASYLIKGLLKKDPKKRLTISEIKNSPFYISQMQGIQIKRGIQLGIDTIYVDDIIIEKLINYGVDPQLARQNIISNSHNSTTATYYLLLNKFIHDSFKAQKSQNSQIKVNSINTTHIKDLNKPTQQEKLITNNDLKINKIDSQSIQNSINQKKQNINHSNSCQEVTNNLNYQLETQLVISSNDKVQHDQISNIYFLSNSKTQQSEGDCQQNQEQNQKIIVNKNKQIIQNRKIQTEQSNSNEEYYTGGIQQQRNNYNQALGNYHNHMIQKINENSLNQLQKTNFILQQTNLSNLQNFSIPNKQNNNHISEGFYSARSSGVFLNATNVQNTLDKYNIATPRNSTNIIHKTSVKNQTKGYNLAEIQTQYNGQSIKEVKQSSNTSDQIENLATSLQSQTKNIENKEKNNQQPIQKQNNFIYEPKSPKENNFQSKKISQVDISTDKYFELQQNKMKLNLKKYSTENTTYLDTTPSPKENYQTVLQSLDFSKQNSAKNKESSNNKPELNIYDQQNKNIDLISYNSPSNRCDSVNQNPTQTPKSNKQHILQEHAKKIEVIKRIMDQIQISKQTNQKLYTDGEVEIAKANILETNSLFTQKRKSVPLFLISQKNEQYTQKSNIQDAISANNTYRGTNIYNSQSNITKQNSSSSNLNKINYKSSKINKTLNPSLTQNLNLKQENENVKSDREFTSKVSTKQNVQSSLLKQTKDCLLYYPEGRIQNNKKTNQLRMIFNNDKTNQQSLDKILQKNTLQHSKNSISSHLSTSQSTSSNQQKNKQTNSSLVQNCKMTNQFFSSPLYQQQKNKQNLISLVNQEIINTKQSLQLSQTQNEVQGQTAQNPTLVSSNISSNFQQILFNNTNSITDNHYISNKILNNFISEPTQSEIHKISEERKGSEQFDDKNYIQDDVKLSENNMQQNSLIKSKQLLINKNIIKSEYIQQNKSINKNQIPTKNQYQIINCFSQNTMHQIPDKKNTLQSNTNNINMTEQQQLQKQSSAQNTQSNSPKSNNYFSKDQIKQLIPKKQNNNMANQKYFLVDF